MLDSKTDGLVTLTLKSNTNPNPNPNANCINVYNIHKNERHNERQCAICRMKCRNPPIVFTHFQSSRAKSMSTHIRSHFLCWLGHFADMSVRWRDFLLANETVYRHLGPETLRTQDTSATSRWVRNVRTVRHQCRRVSVIICVGYTDTKFYYQCGPHFRVAYYFAQLLYSLPLLISDISLLVSNGSNCLNLFHPIRILASTAASASPSTLNISPR